jgi:hypothetical protein
MNCPRLISIKIDALTGISRDAKQFLAMLQELNNSSAILEIAL